MWFKNKNGTGCKRKMLKQFNKKDIDVIMKIWKDNNQKFQGFIDNKYWIDNCKSVDELYEIEARFHIRLLHIHPFEDGNGRTARIILVYNLCNHNLAPCIITKEIKKEYCDYIEKGDEKGLAALIKKLSEKELDAMISLYNELDRKGLIEENKMDPELEKTYNSYPRK